MTDERPDDEHPLDALAQSATPPLDSTSRDRIESALRVQHAERGRAGPRSPIRRGLIVAPALAVLLLVATVALLARDTPAVAALEVRDAQDVVVTLPDGTTVRDPADGYELRDGAVVTVDIGGSVTIDDVTLGGGTTVTVRDGQLVTDVVATTTTDRPGDRVEDEPPSDDPPAGEAPSDEPPAEDRTTTTTTTTVAVDRPSDRPTTTTAPPLDPPRDGERDGERDPPSTTDHDPPPVREDEHDPDGPDEPADRITDGVDVAVALRVRAGDGAVRVAWSAERIGDEPWHVILVRTTDGSVPTGPGDGVTVGTGRHGELLEHRDDFPEDLVEIVYRVLVLDEADGVVASSAPQTLRPRDS